MLYTLTEIALGSSIVDAGISSCVEVLRFDSMMGIFGELYRSGNIAKNSCVWDVWKQTKLFLLNTQHLIKLILRKNNIFQSLTREIEFSFFLSGVKMMAGSINSVELGGVLGLGTALTFSDTGLGFSANILGLVGDLEFLEDCLEFFDCLAFLEGFAFCFPLIFFFTTQLFNCLLQKLKRLLLF